MILKWLSLGRDKLMLHNSSIFVNINWLDPLQYGDIYRSMHMHINGFVCKQLTSRMMIARIRVLCLIIIIKMEVWPICHCLRLGHDTTVKAARLSILSSAYCWGAFRIVRTEILSEYIRKVYFYAWILCHECVNKEAFELHIAVTSYKRHVILLCLCCS